MKKDSTEERSETQNENWVVVDTTC